MTVTPSTRGSFLAGAAMWCLLWLVLLKVDEIAEGCGARDFVSAERFLRWIRQHKGTSLLCAELFNFGTHGISDPVSVTFALGGTLVNVLMIYGYLPFREMASRTRVALGFRL